MVAWSRARRPGAPSGPRPAVTRLCIFAHYDPRGRVAPYIRHHVAALAGLADTLLFVSNSPVDAEAARALAPHCAEIVQRPNAGYDFAAWREGLSRVPYTHYDEVLLVNSSLVGPLFDLAPVFREMAGRPADFWGLYRSLEGGPHLQSFFLCFKRPVVTSAAFKAYWEALPDLDTKSEVIQRCEVRLLADFQAHGFTGAAYVPPLRFPLARRFRLERKPRRLIGLKVLDLARANHTLRFPAELVEAGFPYFKASLLSEGGAARDAIDRIRRNPKVRYDWGLIAPSPPEGA